MIYNENYEVLSRSSLITEMNHAGYIHNLDVMSNDAMVETVYKKYRIEKSVTAPIRYIKAFSKINININNHYTEVYYKI